MQHDLENGKLTVGMGRITFGEAALVVSVLVGDGMAGHCCIRHGGAVTGLGALHCVGWRMQERQAY